MVSFVRFLLIINPAAGRHRAGSRADKLKQLLEAAGHSCTAEVTSGPGHATKLAADGARRHDAVVAVGGDGTLHEVLCGLIQPGCKQLALLGIVPAGSGDSVAMDLGITSTAEAGRRLLAGATRSIDLARVEFFDSLTGSSPKSTLFAANVITWGAGARINRRAEGLRWAGSQRYNLATVCELIRLGKGQRPPSIDGQVCAEELLGVASLTRFSGRGLLLAPCAELNDGYIDLVQFKRTSRLKLARLFAAAFKGKHLGNDSVDWRHTAEFTLDLGPGSELVIDGELMPCNVARVTVERKRLEIFS